MSQGGPKRRIRDNVGRFASVLGTDALLRGELSGSGDYIILGRVEGDSDLDCTVVLERSGSWQGCLRARRIVVAGTLDGEAVATERVELTATAKVRGDIYAPSVAIAEGAIFEGQIRSGNNTEVTHFRDRRQSR